MCFNTVVGLTSIESRTTVQFKKFAHQEECGEDAEKKIVRSRRRRRRKAITCRRTWMKHSKKKMTWKMKLHTRRKTTMRRRKKQGAEGQPESNWKVIEKWK